MDSIVMAKIDFEYYCMIMHVKMTTSVIFKDEKTQLLPQGLNECGQFLLKIYY